MTDTSSAVFSTLRVLNSNRNVTVICVQLLTGKYFIELSFYIFNRVLLTLYEGYFTLLKYAYKGDVTFKGIAFVLPGTPIQ